MSQYLFLRAWQLKFCSCIRLNKLQNLQLLLIVLLCSRPCQDISQIFFLQKHPQRFPLRKWRLRKVFPQSHFLLKLWHLALQALFKVHVFFFYNFKNSRPYFIRSEWYKMEFRRPMPASSLTLLLVTKISFIIIRQFVESLLATKSLNTIEVPSRNKSKDDCICCRL